MNNTHQHEMGGTVKRHSNVNVGMPDLPPNTHQQPSSGDRVEAIVMQLAHVLNLREETVSGVDEIAILKNAIINLLTSHSQAIRERVKKMRKDCGTYKSGETGTCRVCDYTPLMRHAHNKVVDDILALLNDSK